MKKLFTVVLMIFSLNVCAESEEDILLDNVVAMLKVVSSEVEKAEKERCKNNKIIFKYDELKKDLSKIIEGILEKKQQYHEIQNEIEPISGEYAGK